MSDMFNDDDLINAASDAMGDNDLADLLTLDLTDENGETVRVQIVEQFSYAGKNYVIAYDLDDDESSYILEVRETPEGDELVSIDDEEEFNRICKLIEDSEDDEDESE